MAANMADADLDPQAFLKTVRDLSDKRQREDNERYERLEAQILQDRTARLERKMERERSLSPEKTPQSVHSSSSRTPLNTGSPNGSRPSSPMRESSREDSVRSFRSERASPGPGERPSPTKPSSPSAAMPSRANTMSWQRRPQSGMRSRPLSMLAAENASRASTEALSDSRPTSRDEPTQQDIAESLSTKDPSWFKQTPDRGGGSAAYRRNRDEELDTGPGVEKRHLPGLSTKPSSEGLESRYLPAKRSGITSPPQLSPRRDLSATQEEVEQGVKSMSLEAPVSAARATTPEVERAAFGRTVPGLNSRTSANERPSSPTKGMGGFVQSAMMKRTDSVSKRWSNQPAGLGRQDSTASLRSGFGSIRSNVAASNSMPRLEGARTSAEPSSRPGSSHSTVSGISNFALPETDQLDKSSRHMSPSRQTGSMHSRSKSHASLRDNPSQSSDLPPTFSPPLSPSKRWSPTKSSWLESALARPESPTKQLTSDQPSWMTELSKAKQQRNSVATLASHDDVVVEMGTASIKSFQPMKASTMSSNTPSEKNITSREVTSTEVKRSFTPPTKAKPPALAGKPSKERLLHQTESPVSAPSSAISVEPVASSEVDNASTMPSNSFRTMHTQLAPAKPKPSTPPKTDFRSTLKPRQTSGEQSQSSEPEFRNALGKLKKANTQNYVAPDVLKNNILRGKAGLALTGGPQKAVRRDEFKESIIAKKTEMKAKTPELAPKPFQKEPTPVSTPEALQVKKGLQRSNSSTLSAGTPNARRDITPEALARHKTLRGKPTPPSPAKSAKLSEVPAAAPFSSKSGMAVDVTSQVHTPAATIHHIEESDPPVQVSKPVEAIEKPTNNSKSNKFADRFNPALAGLLARGPPPPASELRQTISSGAERDTNAGNNLKMTSSAEEPKGGELTHMTKGRARGPKRRKPQTTQAQELSDVAKHGTSNSMPMPKKSSGFDTSPTSSVKQPLQPRPKSVAIRTLSMTLSDRNGDKATNKQKPPTPVKSATLPIGSSSAVGDDGCKETTTESAIAAITALTGATKPLPTTITRALPQAGLPTSDHVRESSATAIERENTERATVASRDNASPTAKAYVDGSNEDAHTRTEEDKENAISTLPSVRNAAAKWGKTEATRTSSPRGTPIRLPSKADEEAAMRSAGLLSNTPLRYKSAKPDGLGISTSTSDSPTSGRFPLSPPSSGGTPVRPAKSSRVVSQSLEGASSVKDDDVVTAPKTAKGSAGRTARLLSDHFGRVPVISTRLELDAQSVLTSSLPAPCKTLRKSIQLLSNNGKLTPLPTEKEYILFSSAMYIITHVFGSPTGQRQTEVFLWAGGDVTAAAIEDAQIFAKRAAKDAGAGSRTSAPISVIRQLREPASFFQALGGIVIIRQGSHADTATKPYMLCGRPHLGHIAFDEVDFSLDSLAPAFPYIVVHPVTIQETQVYLWKGSGCGPEAVGSARLISMDLSSRDVIEVSQGSEPEIFTSLFPSQTSSTAKSAHQSVVSERSPARLFRLDMLPPRRSSSTFFGFFNKRPSSPSPGVRPGSSASNRSLHTPPTNDDALTALTEIHPFSQDDFEPENIYILDIGGSVLIVPGPLLSASASQALKPKDANGMETKAWEHLFAQACLLGSDYAMLAAGLQDRQKVPGVKVVLGSLGREVEMIFRGWDGKRGLWGAASLMAGRRSAGGGEGEVKMLDVGEVLDCCAR
ncbi:hypothetical protein CAC42_7049 [Sphaceloma murrayae]|uniref:Uncharacterized protein n=1 Tax=Sphaceloma murrayae TaxID=2082308 RepID=A0A2K1QQJ2_9PEZI|nr:hypothetical protein CAC42_7049 [Sphaceloma murrayae]